MFRTRLNNLLKTLFSFSPRERRRVLLLLPLLMALCLLFVWQDKPRFEKSFTLYSDRVLDSVQDNRVYPQANRRRQPIPASENRNRYRSDDSLFVFDPNTVSQQDLVLLGFSPKQAQVILRYREAGAVFRKPEDLARCYTVSREKFGELAPYIHIGDAFRRDTTTSPRTSFSKSRSGTRGDSGTTSPGQLQPHTIRTPNSTVRTENIPAQSYSDPSGGDRPPHQGRPVELNSADSAALVAVHGIGALTASRILRYREALGGFVSVTQLQEIAGMTDPNYQLILQQIHVDSSKIQKIDINFASPKRLQEHPYFPPKVLNRVLKYRQLKGGWSSTGDLIEQHILSAEQAERLAPYLYFRTR